VGAQEITGIRAGDAHIDSRSAVIAGQNYLRREGVTGTVNATSDVVVVEVYGATKFQILGIVGLSGRRIHVLRSARLVAG
jgi:hypothetical protein